MGTWVMPETQEDRDRVDKILSKSLPCGKDGQNALNAIGNLIGDDVLSDDIIIRAAKILATPLTISSEKGSANGT